MKRRLKSSGVGIEEYVITLEKQLKALEGESRRAEMLVAEVDRLKQVEKEQLAMISVLNTEIENLNKLIVEERQRHFEEMEALKKAHEDAMHALIMQHEQQIRDLKDLHAKEIAQINERHANEIEQLKIAHKNQLDSLKEYYEGRIAELNEQIRQNEERYKANLLEIQESASAQIRAINEAHTENIAQLNSVVNEANASVQKYKAEYDAMLEAKRITEARIKAICGVERDHIDKLSFNELEREYNAFREVYKAQWAKAKRKIRNDHINKQNIKGQNGGQ